MVEVKVDAIRVNLMGSHRVVVLKDLDSNRYLPIWIGQPEAESIVRQGHHGASHLARFEQRTGHSHELTPLTGEDVGIRRCWNSWFGHESDPLADAGRQVVRW